jgi:hypothetical protein
MGAYDPAVNEWATIAHPLGTETGNIASDSERFLYLVVGTSLVRYDPASLETVFLSSPPFPFERWGGLRHLDGVLYGHRGNDTVEFASYDVATDRWRTLSSVPGGAVLGAALDWTRRVGAYRRCRFSVSTTEVWAGCRVRRRGSTSWKGRGGRDSHAC